MSNFSRTSLHPVTKKYINATWLDDYFGEHRYAVKFDGDNTYYSGDYIEELETKDIKN